MACLIRVVITVGGQLSADVAQKMFVSISRSMRLLVTAESSTHARGIVGIVVLGNIFVGTFRLPIEDLRSGHNKLYIEPPIEFKYKNILNIFLE